MAEPSPRVYFVRRIAAALGVVVLAVVLVSLLSIRFADATQPVDPRRAAPVVGSMVNSFGSAVVVQPGDTLWSLARKVHPNGDVRPLVAELARAHGGSALRAGDRIAIPAASLPSQPFGAPS